MSANTASATSADGRRAPFQFQTRFIPQSLGLSSEVVASLKRYDAAVDDYNFNPWGVTLSLKILKRIGLFWTSNEVWENTRDKLVRFGADLSQDQVYEICIGEGNAEDTFQEGFRRKNGLVWAFGANALTNGRYKRDLRAVNFSLAVLELRGAAFLAGAPDSRRLCREAIKSGWDIQNSLEHQYKELVHQAFAKRNSLRSSSRIQSLCTFLARLDPSEASQRDGAYGDEGDEELEEEHEETDQERQQRQKGFYTGSLLTVGGVSFSMSEQNGAHPLELGLRFLYNDATLHRYRREGKELRECRLVPHQELCCDEQGRILCHHCGKPESQHSTGSVHTRATHAFKPSVVTKSSQIFNTCSWERPFKNCTIKDFVYSKIHTNTGALFSKTFRYRKMLAEEVANTVNEDSLPVLDRKKSEQRYGPAVSFQNGVFFTRTCVWFPYKKLQQEQADGRYLDLITHYVDVWFFYTRYMTALLGRRLSLPQIEDKYDPPDDAEDRCIPCGVEPEFENELPNLVCSACKKPKHLHSKSCRVADFSVLHCVHCDCPSEECECGENACFTIIDVAKGLGNVRTPFLSGILRDQFGKLPDFKSYLGIEYHFFVQGGVFIQPKNPSDWAVIPGIIGIAGSGKSLFLNALTNLVPQEKVGVLSADSQSTFGLEALISEDGSLQKKYAIYEASGRFRISPQQFQSMSCGERISFNRKNKTAYSANWKESGFFIGNTKMSWEDNGGALRRRMVLFKFDEAVPYKDSQLNKRLYSNLGALLFKCCWARKDAMERFGSMDLLCKDGKFSHPHPNCLNKGVLPPSMLQWNARLLLELNPLHALMTTGLQDADPDNPMFLDNRVLESEDQRCYVPLRMVNNAYRRYCKERYSQMAVSDLTRDIWHGCFQKLKLKVKSCTKMWRERRQKLQYVFGIGSINDHSTEYQDVADILQNQEAGRAVQTRYSASNEDEDDDDEFGPSSLWSERLTMGPPQQLYPEFDRAFKRCQKLVDQGNEALVWGQVDSLIDKLTVSGCITEPIPETIVERFNSNRDFQNRFLEPGDDGYDEGMDAFDVDHADFATVDPEEEGANSRPQKRRERVAPETSQPLPCDRESTGKRMRDTGTSGSLSISLAQEDSDYEMDEMDECEHLFDGF